MIGRLMWATIGAVGFAGVILVLTWFGRHLTIGWQ